MAHETPHIADRADNDPREDPEALHEASWV